MILLYWAFISYQVISHGDIIYDDISYERMTFSLSSVIVLGTYFPKSSRSKTSLESDNTIAVC